MQWTKERQDRESLKFGTATSLFFNLDLQKCAPRSVLICFSREPTTLQRKAAPQNNTTQQRQGTPTFVLYVWHDKEESNSVQALQMVQEYGIVDVIQIVDVRSLRFHDIPEWLQGVPTLLSVEDETVYKGTMCAKTDRNCRKRRDVCATTGAASLPPDMIPVQMMRMQPGQPMSGDPPAQFAGVAPPQQQQPAAMQQQQLPSMRSDEKVSLSDMQGEIDAILKRREEMMQQSQARRTQDHCLR